MDMLSMEETFIVTGIAVLLVGTILGLLAAWIFQHDNGQDDNR